MNFLKKFLFIFLFIIFWDIISYTIDYGLVINFKKPNIMNYILKTFIIFIIFLVFNKLIKTRSKGI